MPSTPLFREIEGSTKLQQGELVSLPQLCNFLHSLASSSLNIFFNILNQLHMKIQVAEEVE
jgi:hypothetical protein